MHSIYEEEIRNWLQDELGLPVSDELMEFLEDGEILQDVQAGLRTRSELLHEAHRVLKAGGQRQAPRKSTPRVQSEIDKIAPEEGRWRAISFLLKIEASEREEVKAFREEVLEGKLIRPDEIKDWMFGRAEEFTGIRRISEILIPDDHSTRRVADGYRLEPPLTIDKVTRINMVEIPFFADGVEGDVSSMAIRPGGMFDRLNLLCNGLARSYGWTVPQAVSFVLSDATPLIMPFQWNATYTTPFTGLSRIQMTVDPTLSPNEVADQYSKIRQQIVGERHREQSSKHMGLAVFAAACPADWTWKRKMDEWNFRQRDDHPDWQYQSERTFSRDAIRARQRLLAPEFNFGKENNPVS